MPSWKKINNVYGNKFAQRDYYLDKFILDRDRSIENWYNNGGIVFLEWVRENYLLTDGRKLSWEDPFLEPLYSLFANPWLGRLYISKPAQIGYTELTIAFCAFCLAYLRSPIGLGFEERNKLYAMVGKRIQPVFDLIEILQTLKQERAGISGREDIDSKQSITIGGIPLELFYAKVQQGGEDEQAASVIRSFSACAIIIDEFGLCPPSTLDVSQARLAKSFWKNQIFSRAGSTPGVEGGVVDSACRTAEHYFQWNVTCEHCGEFQVLDAFGNFLKPTLIEEDGITEERFVDPQGRPYNWFHHSQSVPGIHDYNLGAELKEGALSTAYIGCRNCGQELSWENICAGEFFSSDRRTSLQSMLDVVNAEKKVVQGHWALDIPKLASKTFDPSTRIRFMLTTRKPSDGIQQFLGKAITLGGGKITLSQLERCKSITPPQRPASLIIGGVDQGRYQYWLLIAKFWYGEESNDKYERWETGFKEIIFWGKINEFADLDEYTRKYSVKIYGCDQEPDYDQATKYGIRHLPASKNSEQKGQIYLIDQVYLQGAQYRRSIREMRKSGKPQRLAKANQIPIYLIDRTFGLDASRDRIKKGLQKFPPHAEYSPKEEENLFYHYTTGDRLLDNTWKEPHNAPDHYHHCDSFIELAALMHLDEKGASGGRRFTTMGSAQNSDYSNQISVSEADL